MKRLWKHLRNLKRDFPLGRPVSVRTHKSLVDHENNRIYGSADLIDDSFRINILRHEDESVCIETLWHEWVHCLLWPRCKFRHSKIFWECYGKIYTKYQD